MRAPARVRWCWALACLAGLAGCGDQGGFGPAQEPDAPVTASSGTGSGASLALAAGTIDRTGDGAAFDPSVAIDGTTLRFRRVDGPGGPWFLACCETTRTQWAAIATAAGFSDDAYVRPWTEVRPADDTAGIADVRLPASGLSIGLIRTVLAAYRPAGGAMLRLPTDAEWDWASRAGSSRPYAWGDSEDTEKARRFAVGGETRSHDGPDAVGGSGATRRDANALGFYDMQGNVWEPVLDGASAGFSLRGGSWSDNLRSARRTVRQEIDLAIPHALIGVRLVLVTP